MPTMLPTVTPGSASLADVLPDSFGALDGRHGRLRLRPVRSAVVVVVDGLGAHALAARSGHARHLSGARARSLDSVVPTTTAAALTTLMTGVWPGEHGLVGYRSIDRVGDRVVNQLSGWDDRMVPETWQRHTTVFERAASDSVPATAIGPKTYDGSGLSRAILRGARYHGEDDLRSRFRYAAQAARTARSLSYVYVPELDKAGHRDGVDGDSWLAALETLDALVADLEAELPADTGLLLTADHGMVDIRHDAHVLLSEHRDIMRGVRHVAGEPRFLHLGIEAGVEADVVAEAWRERFGATSWIATRAEAIDASWFGTSVAEEVVGRIGDVLVAPRKRIAFYDDRDGDDPGRRMVGQHGSLTPEERSVPLLLMGRWRR